MLKYEGNFLYRGTLSANYNINVFAYNLFSFPVFFCIFCYNLTVSKMFALSIYVVIVIIKMIRHCRTYQHLNTTHSNSSNMPLILVSKRHLVVFLM